MKPYPAYKDSGVDWLGQVPEGWEVCLAKRAITVRSGDMISAADESDGGFPIIGGNGVRAYTDKTNTDADTLVIGRVGALCGCVHHILEPFWASEHAYRVIEKKKIDRRYFFHLLTSLDLNQFAIKTAQPLLNTEIVESRWIPFPPLSEQQVIAAFLDRETAKIDGLIEEQRRLIALLAEKRQATISHAVTRGLNPSARLKPSGVDWLGDIPEGWEVVPLKRLSPAVSVGVVVNPSNYVAEEGLPFIYGGDIREGVISYDTARRISASDSASLEKSRLRTGDILTVRVGAPGVSAVVGLDAEGGNCASVMLIRRGEYSSNWLCYAMNSRHVRYQVEVVQYGAAQEQFNISHAVDFKIVTPPKEEAKAIADYLDVQTSLFDALTETSTSAITLLQERRAALISAAVTGKIDVRDLATVQEAA